MIVSLSCVRAVTSIRIKLLKHLVLYLPQNVEVSDSSRDLLLFLVKVMLRYILEDEKR